jgi:rubredoxin
MAEVDEAFLVFVGDLVFEESQDGSVYYANCDGCDAQFEGSRIGRYRWVKQHAANVHDERNHWTMPVPRVKYSSELGPQDGPLNAWQRVPRGWVCFECGRPSEGFYQVRGIVVHHCEEHTNAAADLLIDKLGYGGCGGYARIREPWSVSLRSLTTGVFWRAKSAVDGTNQRAQETAAKLAQIDAELRAEKQRAEQEDDRG